MENKNEFETSPETGREPEGTEAVIQEQSMQVQEDSSGSLAENTEGGNFENKASFGNDYNSRTSQQNGQYSYTPQEQEFSREQSAGWQQRNSSGYKAPDYGYQPGSRRNQDSYQDSYQAGNQNSYQNSYQTGNQNGYQNSYQTGNQNSYQNSYQNDSQGFHNEYQEPGSGYQNGNGKKPGGTAKKIAMIAGCAIVLGIVAAAGVKGIDMLITEKQNNTALLEEQQQSKEIQESIQEPEAGSAGIGSISNAQEGMTASGGEERAASVSDIAENAMPSMVSIDCTVTQTYNYFGQNYSQDATGSGSGFIIEENDKELFIATNNHVVEGANSIEITFIDGEKAEATTKGTDSTADLAVVSVKKSDLKKDTMKQIKVAAIGESDDVRLGEMVVAIGNALGYGQSVTVGYVSAKDREVKVSAGEKMVLLQTDAAINPGNSGGALINLQGQVIGIPTIKYADSTVEGMGFAIPISRANPILEELAKREVLTESEQGYLGISCLDVTSDANKMYGMPVGVYVSEVSDDGAAKAAGIQVGDIITAINGVEASSKEALIEKVHSYRIGTEITLTVQRSHNGTYQEMEFKVTLKGKKTIEGLSGADASQAGNGNSSSGNGNANGGNDDGNSGSSGDIYGNGGYDNKGSENDDFYDFFYDFFN